VVVLSPDRLARNYAHQWLLVEEFEKLGTRPIFLQKGFARRVMQIEDRRPWRTGFKNKPLRQQT
jgi:DNA invertase Pin-like site-specific DNA recombinase